MEEDEEVGEMGVVDGTVSLLRVCIVVQEDIERDE